METVMAAVFITMTLLFAAELSIVVASSPFTTPAFLLLSQQDDGSSIGMSKSVNYRTIFPSDLAKSVMAEGGWSNSLCLGTESPESSVDFAIMFVGIKVKSKDIFGAQKSDPVFADHLKVFFEDSNSSLAFPYVAALDDNTAVESSLISHFEETCGSGIGISTIATLGECSLEGKNVENLADISAVREYLALKMERKSGGPANLIVVCHGGIQTELVADHLLSEVGIFSQLISSVKELGAKYTFLYVSDPRRSAEYKSYQKLERLLAESTLGNTSANSTCDELCQIKKTLLEGIFVGIVLLIILISGLCCMAGIDTPTRFEASQDS